MYGYPHKAYLATTSDARYDPLFTILITPTLTSLLSYVSLSLMKKNSFKSYYLLSLSAQKYIATILTRPARHGYHGLFISKRGYTQFYVPLSVTSSGFSKWLASEFPATNFQKVFFF